MGTVFVLLPLLLPYRYPKNATMARMMMPSGTPRPMPILAEALRPLGRGVGETGCIVEKTDVGDACRGEVGMVEVGKGDFGGVNEVDMGNDVVVEEEVDVRA